MNATHPRSRALRPAAFWFRSVAGLLLGGVMLSFGMASAQQAGDTDQLRTLGQCRGCSFEKLELNGRRMMGVNLTEARFRDVDFSQTGMNIAIFDFAVLENVSFASADLNGVSFRGARLINFSFENADLRGAVFEDATVEGTDLQAGHLCNTQMPNETMDNSDCD